MKTALKSFCYFSLFCMSAFSQGNTLHVALEGSLGINSLFGNSYLKAWESKRSFNAGVMMTKDIFKFASIRSGVSFEQKGAGLKQTATNGDGDKIGKIYTQSKFNYLVIPVLLRLNYGQSIKYFISGGTFIGFLNSQKDVIDVKGSTQETSNGTNTYEKVDLGYSIGGGFDVPVSKRLSLSLEYRFNRGIVDISKYVVEKGTVQTQSSQIITGLNYNFGN